MTPAGIEPTTFRFVAQHLNHCANAVPNSEVLKWLNKLGNIARYKRKRGALPHLEKLCVCASQLQMYKDPAHRHVLQLRWPKPLSVLVND